MRILLVLAPEQIIAMECIRLAMITIIQHVRQVILCIALHAAIHVQVAQEEITSIMEQMLNVMALIVVVVVPHVIR